MTSPSNGSILKLPRGLVAKSDQRYCIHVDLALRHDSAGIAMAHAEDRRVIIDYVQAIMAEDFPGKEIDFAVIREFIISLRGQGFNIIMVTYDSYQSADSIQRLRQAGFNADTLSVDRNTEAYDLLKELIYTGGCALPNHPLLLQELRQLEFIKGKKVDHPPRGSKDVADAVAGAVFNVHQFAMSAPFTFSFDGDLSDIPPGELYPPGQAGVHVIDEGVMGHNPATDPQKIAAQRLREIQSGAGQGWNTRLT